MVGVTEGAAVGARVLRTVGCRVGFADGARVGLVVLGEALGRLLGRALGDTEGRAVGDRLGIREGRVVGWAVGLYVLVGPLLLGWLVGCGETDGAEVGLLLGLPVGVLEGCEDGSTMGATLGYKVGCPSAVLKVYSVAVFSSLLIVNGNTVPLNAKDTASNVLFSRRMKPFGSFEKARSLLTERTTDWVVLTWYCTAHVTIRYSPAEVISLHCMLALFE